MSKPQLTAAASVVCLIAVSARAFIGAGMLLFGGRFEVQGIAVKR